MLGLRYVKDKFWVGMMRHRFLEGMMRHTKDWAGMERYGTS